MAEIKTKSELLAAAIIFGDKEIEIAPRLKNSRGKWIVKRGLSARFELENGRSIEIQYDKRYKRFEMIIDSGSGRRFWFYEDEIQLVLEAKEVLKEIKKKKLIKIND